MTEAKTYTVTLKLKLTEIEINRKAKRVSIVCRKLPKAFRGYVNFTAKDGFQVRSLSCPEISTANIIYIEGDNIERESALFEFKTNDAAKIWCKRAITALKEWDASTFVPKTEEKKEEVKKDEKKINLLSTKIVVKDCTVRMTCITGEKFEKIRGDCFSEDRFLFTAKNGMPVLSSQYISLTSKKSVGGDYRSMAVCGQIRDCQDTIWLPGCNDSKTQPTEASITFSDEKTAQKWALNAKNAIEEWGVFMNKLLNDESTKTYTIEV